MPVTIEEFAKIQTLEGEEVEGKGFATNLTALILPDDSVAYGKMIGITKIRTTITCDSGKHCNNSTTDDQFVTHPKVIEFNDTGGQEASFIKEIAGIVITSDYKGSKLAFCSPECAASHLKREAKKVSVIEFPSGKGKRTFGEEPKSVVLEGE